MTHNKAFHATALSLRARTAVERPRWVSMKGFGPVFAVFLAACVAGGGPRGNSVHPAQLFSGDYINVKAPASEGWLLINSSGSGITFGKQGPSTSESFIAGVLMFGMAPTGTPAEFKELVKAGTRRDTPPERYDIQRESLKYTDERGYPCVRYQALAKDKKPQGLNAPLLLALHGLYCRHPKRPETGFAAVYSFRGKAEHPALRSEAESFIQGVQAPEK